MRRFVKLFGISIALVAVLVLSITGTVLAAGGNSGGGNQGEECPYGDNLSGDCEPNAYSCNNSYEYATPGPHGPKNAVMNGTQTAAGNGVQNQYQKGKVTE